MVASLSLREYGRWAVPRSLACILIRRHFYPALFELSRLLIVAPYRQCCAPCIILVSCQVIKRRLMMVGGANPYGTQIRIDYCARGIWRRPILAEERIN